MYGLTNTGGGGGGSAAETYNIPFATEFLDDLVNGSVYKSSVILADMIPAAASEYTAVPEYKAATFTEYLLDLLYGTNAKVCNLLSKVIYNPDAGGDSGGVTSATFPAEYGKFVSAVATVTGSEGYKDWVYTWSIHFENGTLPVVVGKDATSAAIDESLFEYDTNERLNGAVWTINGWKNSIASDQGGLMIWTDTKGTKQWTILKSTAAKWGWNNGTNSVHTSAFTFDVQNDGKTLVVTKNGTAFFTGTAGINF